MFENKMYEETYNFNKLIHDTVCDAEPSIEDGPGEIVEHDKCSRIKAKKR